MLPVVPLYTPPLMLHRASWINVGTSRTDVERRSFVPLKVKRKQRSVISPKRDAYPLNITARLPAYSVQGSPGTPITYIPFVCDTDCLNCTMRYMCIGVSRFHQDDATLFEGLLFCQMDI